MFVSKRSDRGEGGVGWVVRNPVFDDSIATGSPHSGYLGPGTVRYPYFSSRSQQRTPSKPSAEGDKDSEDPEKNILGILEKHATEVSTAHGYPLIFKSKRWYGKLFWILVLVGAFGAFTRQSYILLTRYFDAPVTVELQVVSKTYLDFPAVTVCNTNKVRRSSVSESKHRQVLTVDDNTPTAYKVPCSPGDFKCEDGTECTKRYLVCDGIRHCSDRSDEQQACIYGNCGKDQFMCKTGGDLGVCISSSLVCDNTLHCYGGEDEKGCLCTNTEYKCDIGNCIPKDKTCDGFSDCQGKDDEQDSLCDADELHDNGLQCGGTTLYVPVIYVCDGFLDCTDGSDETDDACAAKQDKKLCENNEFVCLAKQYMYDNTMNTQYYELRPTCYPLYYTCNNVYDCEDRSDESRLYCTVDTLRPTITNKIYDMNYYSTDSTIKKPFINGTTSRGALVTWEPLIAIDNFGDDQLIFKTRTEVLKDDGSFGPGYGYFVTKDLDSGDFFPEGHYHVTQLVQDQAGNFDEYWFEIDVNPVSEIIVIHNCPVDVLAETGGIEMEVAVFWTPPTADLQTIDDAVNLERGSPTGIVNYDPGDRFPVGQTSVVYFFESQEASKMCTFKVNVTIVDREPPIITNCDTGIDSRVDAIPPRTDGEDGSIFYNWQYPTATDISHPNENLMSYAQSRNTDDTIFHPGRTTVTIGFADKHGNTAECSFQVIVSDSMPPDVKCPRTIRHSVPVGVTGRFVRWDEPTVTDASTNSGEQVTVTQTHTSNDFFLIGNTIVEYDFVDWADNKATCTFEVSIAEDPDLQLVKFNCSDDETIPVWKTCNSVPDCSNGRDESVCGSHKVICSIDSRPCRSANLELERCIKNTQECDFNRDCPDNSDEQFCNFPDDCGADYFHCPSTRVCLHRYLRCNGKTDCADNTDELNCEDEVVPESPFSQDWYQQYILESFPTDKDYQAISTVFEEKVFKPRGFSRVKGEDPPDWNTFVSFSSSPDFSDLGDVLVLNSDEIKDYGHQKEDLILQCTYNEQQCDISKITQTFDDTYGNCFTFNYVGNNSDEIAVQSTRANSNYGLKMTLHLEQSEYLSIFGREAGIRVSINPADSVALPSEDGITVRPGTISSIGLRYENVSRLGGRYSNCVPDNADWQDLRHGRIITITKRDRERYDRKRCLRACLYGNLLQACGCSDTIELDGPRCRILNNTQDLCRQYIRYLHDNSALGCNCGNPCNDRYFTKTVSQSAWPSDVYLKHLLRTIHSISGKTIDINDRAAVDGNLVRLEVFFEELNYAVTRDVPAYLEESLFSDIGGTVGLYIGFSLITVCEFAAVVVLLIRYCCNKYSYYEEYPRANEQRQETQMKQRRDWEDVYGSTWDFNKMF